MSSWMLCWRRRVCMVHLLHKVRGCGVGEGSGLHAVHVEVVE